MPVESKPLAIQRGTLVTPDGLVRDRDLLIVGGRITAMGSDLALPDGCDRLDATSCLVSPGFIDTHVHGGLQFDTLDADPAGLRAIAAHLARHGVTSWLPTTVACPAPQLERVLSAIAQARREGTGAAEILGAHLESNFISPRFKGAQPPDDLRPTSDAELRDVLRKHAGVIRLVTLAPELEGAEQLVRELVARGIVVSVGHSDATYDQVMRAVEAGATRVTHLCNAQRGFHHREPGVLGAGLACDGLATEIIADLEHVHPAGLVIALRCKGPQRLMLVSDALRGTGLPEGRYELGGRPTWIDGRVARLEDGTIAGSIITLDRAVRNLIAATGAGVEEAIATATLAPARSLGLDRKGRLVPGADADLVVLGADLMVQRTLVAGTLVHSA
jgi:N-acetylglucosamine-6-phosphate deacetylase